jgi:hypothetical protein
MPQLEKGGKYVFGWSAVGEDGSVPLPEEARAEYGLAPGERLVLTSGSRTSGGFNVGKLTKLARSPLRAVLDDHPELGSPDGSESPIAAWKARRCCCLSLGANGRIAPSEAALATFGVRPGDRLLCIRGSNLAFVLVVRGPLVELAKRHPEVPVCF